MKKFFLGFNQQQVLEYGLDFKDLIILRFIIDGVDRKIFAKRIVDGEEYYWIKMQGIMDSYPIMNIKNKAVMRRKMKKLEDMGFLKYRLYFHEGTYTLYSATDLARELCKSKMNKENNEEDKIIIEKEEKVIEEIIDYLNSAIKARYKSNSGGTIKFIKRLLKDGFTIEDFKEVIDSKSKEWLNTKYEKYLRPSTLFRRQNFEEYLNGVQKKEECNYAAYDEY